MFFVQAPGAAPPWLAKRLGRAVANYLQPPTYLVRRPKLQKNPLAITVLLGAIMAVAAVVITVVSVWRDTYVFVEENFRPCTPSDSGWLWEDTSGSESITEYPIFMNLHVNLYLHLALAFTASPDDRSVEELKATLLDTPCDNARLADGFTYSNSFGLTTIIPSLATTCVSPNMTGLTISTDEVGPTKSFAALAGAVKAKIFHAFEPEPRPPSDDMFVLQGVIASLQPLDEGNESSPYQAEIILKGLFPDDHLYEFAVVKRCDRPSREIRTRLTRDCVDGVPYRWSSGCKNEVNQSRAELMQTTLEGILLSDEFYLDSMYGTVEDLMNGMCARFSTTLRDVIHLAEGQRKAQYRRDVETIVDVIIDSVMMSCPFVFQRRRQETRSRMYVMALMFPMLSLAARFMTFVMPLVYISAAAWCGKDVDLSCASTLRDADHDEKVSAMHVLPGNNDSPDASFYSTLTRQAVGRTSLTSHPLSHRTVVSSLDNERWSPKNVSNPGLPSSLSVHLSSVEGMSELVEKCKEEVLSTIREELAVLLPRSAAEPLPEVAAALRSPRVTGKMLGNAMMTEGGLEQVELPSGDTRERLEVRDEGGDPADSGRPNDAIAPRVQLAHLQLQASELRWTLKEVERETGRLWSYIGELVSQWRAGYITARDTDTQESLDATLQIVPNTDNAAIGTTGQSASCAAGGPPSRLAGAMSSEAEATLERCRVGVLDEGRCGYPFRGAGDATCTEQHRAFPHRFIVTA